MVDPAAAATWLPEPYAFVRALTLSLATFWTLRGLVRGVVFWRGLADRLARFGLSRALLARAAGQVALRATVLDPLNLALLLAIAGLWWFAGAVA